MCLDRMMQNIHNISIAEIPKDCYSVSVGISVVNLKRSKNFETLYSESDTALYESKQKGKNNYSYFSDNV